LTATVTDVSDVIENSAVSYMLYDSKRPCEQIYSNATFCTQSAARVREVSQSSD